MDEWLIDHGQAKFDCQRVNLCQIRYFKSKYHTLFDKTTTICYVCWRSITELPAITIFSELFPSTFHHVHGVFHCFPPFSWFCSLFSTIFMVFSIVFHHFHGFFQSFFPSLHRFFPPKPPPNNAQTQRFAHNNAPAVSEWPDSTMSRAGAQGSPPLVGAMVVLSDGFLCGRNKW